ncbi:L,D-transpeptidase [Polyangium sorediatum]|uniref:L,D-transpeptidase n=1 Tax=Polyangium sorediatum TaxID=889274 RepID=A0ABT6P519_9BACT|nr:L,D-transpeptidase [Polyangium sorediatum]MDI1435719.1 L,D-transpeptidase [Polyangium sorediatum]
MLPRARPSASLRSVGSDRARFVAFTLAGLVALAALGCKRPGAAAQADGGVPDDAAAPPPVVQGENSHPDPPPPPDKPLLGITAFVTTVYAEPRDTSKKLGYLRVGAKVARSDEPVGKAGCPGGWYEIYPKGFVCAGDDATTDLESPILKAAAKRPDLKAALPYRYAFVRAVLPLYVKVPTAKQQYDSEFKLQEHLDWYKQNEATVNQVVLGAPDVPIDDRGVPVPGKHLGEMGLGKNSQELALGQLLGGETDADPIPFWLEGGKRLVPNISDFKVPDFAVFADRARRHTGLSLIGSFPTGEDNLNRRFAITTDLRLAPNTKIKPDLGSPWHGIELTDEFSLPLAFVRTQGAKTYRISKGKATPEGDVEWRSIHALAGTMKTVEGVKYYRTKDKRWLSQLDVGLAVPPASFPEDAEKGKKWIEISITNQTFVMWEGKRPIYATLVSTGKAGLDDPKKTTATVRGVFKIRNKHITATMDSNEGSSVGGAKITTVAASHSPDGGGGKPAAPKAGDKNAKPGGKPDPKAPKGGKPAAKPAAPKPGAAKAKPTPAAAGAEKIPTRGDGEYGVTRRRGEGTFQLRDVPYIQYFESGYALHTAYWHDVFGTPRSHGCVNLSPVDAHRVFLWTDPPVPESWHAVNAGEDFGEGTTVIIHE